MNNLFIFAGVHGQATRDEATNVSKTGEQTEHTCTGELFHAVVEVLGTRYKKNVLPVAQKS